jgi:bacteriochlorophyll 4-vinyl reductase
MLIASLHQGISDLIPTRLEFYENWLHATGMRDGRIGLAPLAAVLSFLRQEGESYDLVTGRAGEYAAQWTFDNLSPIKRSLIRSLPTTLRARIALQMTRRVIGRSYHGSRAVSGLRRGQGTITLRSSVFCSVREPWARPLCGYYAAALTRALSLVSVNGKVHVHSCQGTGAPACVIAMRLLPDERETRTQPMDK